MPIHTYTTKVIGNALIVLWTNVHHTKKPNTYHWQYSTTLHTRKPRHDDKWMNESKKLQYACDVTLVSTPDIFRFFFSYIQNVQKIVNDVVFLIFALFTSSSFFCRRRVFIKKNKMFLLYFSYIRSFYSWYNKEGRSACTFG